MEKPVVLVEQQMEQVLIPTGIFLEKREYF